MYDGAIACLPFRRQPPEQWSFSWPLTRWVFQHAADYDLMHVHALFAYPTLAACTAARRRGVPYVLQPHGMLDPWALQFRGWKKGPYLRLIERRNLIGAAAVHATSRLEERGIQALGLPLRLATIPVGIDVPEWVCEREPVRADNLTNVLFLSRLHPKKGLETLIEAVANLDRRLPFRLVVAGDGEARFKSRLDDIVKTRGVSDRVRFVGFVSGDEKRRLLAQTEVFVLPSHSENFGVAVAEAMAASIPVVVSDRVGLAASVEQAGAGLVVPTDAGALVAALGELLGDPDKRRRMGAAGRAYVEKELSWPRVAGQLVRLYEEIVRTHWV